MRYSKLSEKITQWLESCQRGYNDYDALQANLSINNRFSIVDMYKIRNMVIPGTALSFLISTANLERRK